MTKFEQLLSEEMIREENVELLTENYDYIDSVIGESIIDNDLVGEE